VKEDYINSGNEKDERRLQNMTKSCGDSRSHLIGRNECNDHGQYAKQDDGDFERSGFHSPVHFHDVKIAG